jgi:hypothetical protein
MGFIEDMFKGNLGASLAIGIGAAILGPTVIPVVARAVKPVVKAVIKGGLRIYDSGKEGVSGAVEAVEDLVAEARQEMERPDQAGPGSTEEKTPGHPRGTPHEVS